MIFIFCFKRNFFKTEKKKTKQTNKFRHERTDFAKIFALLQSTTEFIKQKSGKECLLIVSETSESNDLPKSRILLSDRWLPLVISLDGK